MNNNTEKAFRAIPAALEKVTQKTIIFGEKTFSEFIDFLGKTSVIQLAMATIIGLFVTDLATGFTSSIISPVINRVLHDDEKKKLDQYDFNIFGIKFEIGKLIILFMKFIILIGILFVVIKFIPQYTTSYITGLPYHAAMMHQHRSA